MTAICSFSRSLLKLMKKLVEKVVY